MQVGSNLADALQHEIDTQHKLAKSNQDSVYFRRW